MSSAIDAELKVKVWNFLEIAYSKKKGFTEKILMTKGRFTLKVDSSGQATLSSKLGIYTYNVSEALQSVSAEISGASITFSNGGDGKIRYHAAFTVDGVQFGVTSIVDVNQLIQECSGILCRAARGLVSEKRRDRRAFDALHYYLNQ